MPNKPFKMYGKSPMMKALVGNQGNLPVELQEKIKAAPKMYGKKAATKMYDKAAPTKNYKKGHYGA